MPTKPLIPTIDYTSRDFEALRADMIRLIRARIPQWTADNYSDFGVALVEAFAYAVDIVNYYIDRVGNEAYLTTAVQRESLFSIADMFNYTPRGALPAVVSLDFINSTTQDIELPAFTRCQATVLTSDGAVIKNFETNEARTIGAMALDSLEPMVTNGITATEGRTYRDITLGTSNGYARQQYILPMTSVLPSSLKVYVVQGDSQTEWLETPDLGMATSSDKVFQVLRQADGSSMIRFGNRVYGEIPPKHGIITSTFRVGGGDSGNVPPFAITTVVDPSIPGLAVINAEAAFGGQSSESMSSIRINAARSFRSRDRAVTTSDYVAVTENVSDIAKAKAVGNNGSSVTVYIVPLNDGTGAPSVSQDLLDFVTGYLMARSMAGVDVVVAPAAWVGVWIELTIYCTATAYREDVAAEVRARLVSLYGFDAVDFDGRVTTSAIQGALVGVRGMEYAEVTNLALEPIMEGEDPEPADSTAAITLSPENAIQYFNPDIHLTLDMQGGIGA